MGTLSAIVLSFLIYVAIGWWLSRVATPEELVSNYNVLIDYAYWPSAVLGGLLGATFSSALSSIVGAPRILQALGDHNIFPGGSFFSKLSGKGEPRNAILFTGVVVVATLMLRDLNSIAPLITMFFLITYTMINLVVLIEQRMNMISFRPTFNIPRFVPVMGTLGCLFTMFIINPSFGLVAISLVVAAYLYLVKRKLAVPYGDMRSGLFVAVAEWAAKHVSMLPENNERAWKANLLVPVQSTRELRGSFSLIRNLVYPRGSLKLIGITGQDRIEKLSEGLMNMTSAFSRENVYTRWSVIKSKDFNLALLNSLQTLQGTFFKPNILFLRLLPGQENEEELLAVISEARANNMGVQLYVEDNVAQLGRSDSINVWLRDKSPDWDLSMDLGNVDLALLSGYKLKTNWGARMRVIVVVNEGEEEAAHAYLQDLLDVARLKDVIPHVEIGTFENALGNAPHADVDFFGLSDEPDLKTLKSYVELTRSACVFVADSGDENILA